MFSRWCYVLVGNNDTGKTSFQRGLIAHLCDEHYDRLPRNVVKPITHPKAPRGLKTIFTANRSYQEKLGEYKTVENYFSSFFKMADVAFVSTHTHGNSLSHAEQMIAELKVRCFNVAGVFWSNDYGSDAQAISKLPWQERLWVENPILSDATLISQQIRRLAKEFSDLLLARSQYW